MSVVKTVCGMCGGDHCGIDVVLEDDKIVDIKGIAIPSWPRLHCGQGFAA